ncbi:MAG TPA: hypothetical protein VKE69_12260, partial [Planctomycetota bacterium]|nr:hypothetical protein [Planctomycetota bacterium]
ADAAAVRAAAPLLEAGAAAFDAWMRDLKDGSIDPAGHARLLAVAAESRAHAAAFLTDAAERAPEGADASLVRAADDLDASSQVFSGILREVFPRPDDVGLAERRAIAAGMLATAKRREASARLHLVDAAAALR